MWYDKLLQIWKIKDLRRNLLFVFALLIVFRVLAHIPIPVVNIANLRDFFSSNQVLGLLNLFSGGGMENFSIVMLGVGPYITASIIFQLLVMIIPSLEEMSKDPQGSQKINQYTRILAAPLALLQSYAMITLLRQSSRGIVADMDFMGLITTMITISAGTMLLMWIGELISEKKIGNGISLLIFVGIITGIPGAIMRTFAVLDSSQIFSLLVFAFVAIVTIVGVVIITEGQRNIPVSYARQIRGQRMYGGSNTYLPLRVNMAGVIPIIFAVSIILFPPMIAQFFLRAKTEFLVRAAEFTIQVFQNQLVYGVLYFVFIFAFTYFYTAVIFHPTQIAENLQKQGGFIPGIRPGRHTADYLAATISRMNFAGALFLGLIAVLPLALNSFFGLQSLVIGGTSVLIVVSVVIETIKQIGAQLTMRDYEGL